MNSKSLIMHLLLITMASAIALMPSPSLCNPDPESAAPNPQSEIPHSAFSSTSLGASRIPHLQYAAAETEPPMIAQAGDEPVDVYGFKRKSPTRAFLQSLLIPGWGQIYAKSSIWKPIMAVSIEAGSWLGYTSFHSNGNDKEVEFKAFADEHWDSTDYIDGLYYTFYRRDQPESIKDAWIDTTTYILTFLEHDTLKTANRSLSHHAWYKEDGSRVAEDEYYENIGKYNQFNFGWDDYRGMLDSLPNSPADTARLNKVSDNRRAYLQMRDDANNEFNKANRMLVAAVANHLLWGFWAALDARAFNRAQDQFGHLESRLQLVRSPSDPRKYMPYLTVGYKF